MKQAELNRAVVRATGESLETVARMGFQEIVMPATKRATPVIGQLPRKAVNCVQTSKRKPSLAA